MERRRRGRAGEQNDGKRAITVNKRSRGTSSSLPTECRLWHAMGRAAEVLDDNDEMGATSSLYSEQSIAASHLLFNMNM